MKVDYLRIPDHKSMFYFFALQIFLGFLNYMEWFLFQAWFPLLEEQVNLYLIGLRHECLNIFMMVANIVTYNKQRLRINNLII